MQVRVFILLYLLTLTILPLRSQDQAENMYLLSGPALSESKTSETTQSTIPEQFFNEAQYASLRFNMGSIHSVKNISASELNRLLTNEIDPDYIKTFRDLVSSAGEPLFDLRDITKLYLNSVSKNDLINCMEGMEVKAVSREELLDALYMNEYKEWQEDLKKAGPLFCNRNNFHTLLDLSLLRSSYRFFIETPKPNLLLAYPALDLQKAFFSPSARPMIEALAENYDIWFITMLDEKDLYRAIRALPGIDLLIISGHGSKSSIQINQPVEGFEEFSYIDIKDKELARYFKKLNQGATIFLNSCNTAKGSAMDENLANTIAGFAPGHRVIAATSPFTISEVIIRQAYPLELDIPEKSYTVNK